MELSDASKIYDSCQQYCPCTNFTSSSPPKILQRPVETVSVNNLAKNNLKTGNSATIGIKNERPVSEKTPMSLVNELARSNKIEHSYILEDEKGRPHEKVFHVTLNFGNESYKATGSSIKKAQHSAAADALKNTSYKETELKVRSSVSKTRIFNHTNPSITPTVELNALAMKRCEPVSYKEVQSCQYPNSNGRSFSNPKGKFIPQLTHIFSVSVIVGPKEFIGEGPTRQAAKHDAALKALRYLKALPPPTPISESLSEKKSEISLLNELALKLKLLLSFEVISETGPAHSKLFVTKCLATGNINGEKINEIVTGEGNSKKTSKKDAARNMMKNLKNLPLPLLTDANSSSNIKRNLKKNKKNMIKKQKAKPEYGKEINPISRLIHIQQAKMENEPVYQLISEMNEGRYKKFTIEVKIGELVSQGFGSNKKLAKLNAAETMLEKMGYQRSCEILPKPSIKLDSSHHNKKNVSFSDDDQINSLSPSLSYENYIKNKKSTKNENKSNKMYEIAKELFTKGSSKYLPDLKENASAIDKLTELTKKFLIEMKFTEYIKGEKSTISVLKINVSPEQITHGSSTVSTEEAREAAAEIGLEMLASLA